MYQTFALTLSPHTGRVSLRPVAQNGMTCQSFMQFADEDAAQAFLTKHQASRVYGGVATINGTYRMEVPVEQKVEIKQ